MNGYKILKCFRKEKRVSGELSCPATGLIVICETSEDIIQEKLPPVIFRYESYHSKTSFSKSDNKLGLRMRKS